MMPKNGGQHIGWHLATKQIGRKWHLLEQLILPGLRGCLVKGPVDLQDVLALDQERCPTCLILVDTKDTLL